MSQQLTKKSGQWYHGCGCGQKPQDVVTAPEGSVELLVRLEGPWTGGSGQRYHFVPNTISIDVAAADAVQLRVEGKAIDAPPGFKGRLARVANEQAEQAP